MPPDFLKGSCSPHPANTNKRHRLYRKFWGVLKDLGVWGEEEYLRRKEQRTSRNDSREIMPDCIIEVHVYLFMSKNTYVYTPYT